MRNPGEILQGILLVLAGVAIVFVCNAGRRSEHFLHRQVRNVNHTRRLLRMRELDPTEHGGIKAGLIFGIVFCLLYLALGIGAIVDGMLRT